MISKVYKTIKAEGLRGIFLRINIRLKRIFPIRAKMFDRYKYLFEGKNGIEFGGKSYSFGPYGIYPVYSLISTLDNCNFGSSTIWEGALSKGKTFSFHPEKPRGNQYISEASELSIVPAETYDFTLSCHMLEHSANPIKTLYEWHRILKVGGTLLLVLPHKEVTFDRRRPVTPLDHMIDDYKTNVSEADLTHLPEILTLHDLEIDAFIPGDITNSKREEFRTRSECNFDNRIMHHHVFDTESAIQLVNYIGFKILDVEPIRTNSILIVSQKVAFKVTPDNTEFIKRTAKYRRTSPFPSDRI